MARKPYRIEVNYPQGRSPQYFLAKDVKFKGKRSKVKKYLGTKPLKPEEVEHYSHEYAFEIESRVAAKKAEMSSALYSADYLSFEQVKKIEELRFLYKTFTDLLTVNEIEAYEQKFEVHYVQGTTSIEGNTLSLKQTHDLLIEGISPKDKPLREINEIQNFKKVKQYRDKYKGKVTVNFIKTLHSIIMDNIDYESSGNFRRTDDIGIIGCELMVAPSIIIEEELQKMIDNYYNSIDNGKYPFEQAAFFHYNFEITHPFADGNGRVGREIFNYMLIKEYYPRLLFLGRDREQYISILKLGNEEKYGEMVESFADLILFQRAEVVKENLKKVVNPQKRDGQMRLTDFGV
ncbi:MAG: Fic family protein [Methanosarcinaceae archaeon]|nr:Fic family protein [Methanosarcinaceae archaeon]